MIQNPTSFSRPALVRLLLAAALLMGLAVAFTVFAGNASAGGDTKITVNSTANIDDGACEGAPNDDEIGNCTLHEAIDMVNNGDADIINFHKPVFSKEQPGVINLCDEDNGGMDLPAIERDVVIDSKNSGVILDGGNKDDCTYPATVGLLAEGFSNGFDFELNGGKNFEIRNIDGEGILLCGGCIGDSSLGTINITGVIIDNVDLQGISVRGSNLEHVAITNSEISSNGRDAIRIDVPCVGLGPDCKLTDSVVDISGNRLQGSLDCEECGDGVSIIYRGLISSEDKISINVTQNEVLNGDSNGAFILFDGCGSGALNIHVDENEDINGIEEEGVRVVVDASACSKEVLCAGCGRLDVAPGDTSDGLDVVVTVNRNGDIENHTARFHGVEIEVFICCEESDSSATVEVNENGRITGEDDGVHIETWICCGDDNSTNVSVNGNDEITGEGDDGISVKSFAGSSTAASTGAGVAGFPSDADDNVCIITVDGNNEIDGVGGSTSHGTGVGLNCFAGALFDGDIFGGSETVAGGPASSGDNNVSTVSVTNNDDIDGDRDGVDIEGLSGSIGGEADENTFTAIVSGNGEITGDDDDGIDINIIAGTPIEEGDDNFAEIIIEENEEVGGNGGEGMDLDVLAGGITDGSEDNHTAISIVQNGSIEGSGDDGDAGGDGIDIESSVCCDEANSNTIDISNNKDEITGHDGDGIDIATCCSINYITVLDNLGNIRGGEGDGLRLEICGDVRGGGIEFPGKFAGAIAGGAGAGNDCLEDDATDLQVINNSFSDSERDGIHILGGTFEDKDLGIKSVISNNVIEGNGDDGINIDLANGLNIGPANEIFLNGTNERGAGIEIDWEGSSCALEEDGRKFPPNHNRITQNMIYDNFGLGIDLVGWDADGSSGFAECEEYAPGEVGCDNFPDTPITPNDCLPFPELQTQSGDKLIGIACSECTVEVFVADNDPANNDDADGVPHGEGAVYIVSGEADDDGSFSIELPCDLGPGDLTATATDKLKNTSEFAANLITLGTSSCATDTPIPTDTPVPTNTPLATDTPVPTNTPVLVTETPVPEKICGDVNEDGVANSVDASLVLQLKAGLIDSLPNESSGDVNGDGALTSVDAALLLQFTAGLISEDALTC